MDMTQTKYKEPCVNIGHLFGIRQKQMTDTKYRPLYIKKVESHRLKKRSLINTKTVYTNKKVKSIYKKVFEKSLKLLKKFEDKKFKVSDEDSDKEQIIKSIGEKDNFSDEKIQHKNLKNYTKTTNEEIDYHTERFCEDKSHSEKVKRRQSVKLERIEVHNLRKKDLSLQNNLEKKFIENIKKINFLKEEYFSEEYEELSTEDFEDSFKEINEKYENYVNKKEKFLKENEEIYCKDLERSVQEVDQFNENGNNFIKELSRDFENNNAIFSRIEQMTKEERWNILYKSSSRQKSSKIRVLNSLKKSLYFEIIAENYNDSSAVSVKAVEKKSNEDYKTKDYGTINEFLESVNVNYFESSKMSMNEVYKGSTLDKVITKNLKLCTNEINKNIKSKASMTVNGKKEEMFKNSIIYKNIKAKYFECINIKDGLTENRIGKMFKERDYRILKDILKEERDKHFYKGNNLKCIGPGLQFKFRENSLDNIILMKKEKEALKKESEMSLHFEEAKLIIENSVIFPEVIMNSSMQSICDDKGDEIKEQSMEELLQLSATDNDLLSKHLSSEREINEILSKHLSSEEVINDDLSKHLSSEEVINDDLSKHLSSEEIINENLSKHLSSEEIINENLSKHLSIERVIKDDLSKHLSSEREINEILSKNLSSEKVINENLSKHISSKGVITDKDIKSVIENSSENRIDIDLVISLNKDLDNGIIDFQNKKNEITSQNELLNAMKAANEKLMLKNKLDLLHKSQNILPKKEFTKSEHCTAITKFQKSSLYQFIEDKYKECVNIHSLKDGKPTMICKKMSYEKLRQVLFDHRRKKFTKCFKDKSTEIQKNKVYKGSILEKKIYNRFEMCKKENCNLLKIEKHDKTKISKEKKFINSAFYKSIEETYNHSLTKIPDTYKKRDYEILKDMLKKQRFMTFNKGNNFKYSGQFLQETFTGSLLETKIAERVLRKQIVTESIQSSVDTLIPLMSGRENIISEKWYFIPTVAIEDIHSLETDPLNLPVKQIVAVNIPKIVKSNMSNASNDTLQDKLNVTLNSNESNSKCNEFYFKSKDLEMNYETEKTDFIIQSPAHYFKNHSNNELKTKNKIDIKSHLQIKKRNERKYPFIKDVKEVEDGTKIPNTFQNSNLFQSISKGYEEYKNTQKAFFEGQSSMIHRNKQYENLENIVKKQKCIALHKGSNLKCIGQCPDQIFKGSLLEKLIAESLGRCNRGICPTERRRISKPSVVLDLSPFKHVLFHQTIELEYLECLRTQGDDVDNKSGNEFKKRDYRILREIVKAEHYNSFNKGSNFKLMGEYFNQRYKGSLMDKLISENLVRYKNKNIKENNMKEICDNMASRLIKVETDLTEELNSKTFSKEKVSNLNSDFIFGQNKRKQNFCSTFEENVSDKLNSYDEKIRSLSRNEESLLTGKDKNIQKIMKEDSLTESFKENSSLKKKIKNNDYFDFKRNRRNKNILKGDIFDIKSTTSSDEGMEDSENIKMFSLNEKMKNECLLTKKYKIDGRKYVTVFVDYDLFNPTFMPVEQVNDMSSTLYGNSISDERVNVAGDSEDVKSETNINLLSKEYKYHISKDFEKASITKEDSPLVQKSEMSRSFNSITEMLNKVKCLKEKRNISAPNYETLSYDINGTKCKGRAFFNVLAKQKSIDLFKGDLRYRWTHCNNKKFKGSVLEKSIEKLCNRYIKKQRKPNFIKQEQVKLQNDLFKHKILNYLTTLPLKKNVKKRNPKLMGNLFTKCQIKFQETPLYKFAEKSYTKCLVDQNMSDEPKSGVIFKKQDFKILRNIVRTYRSECLSRGSEKNKFGLSSHQLYRGSTLEKMIFKSLIESNMSTENKSKRSLSFYEKQDFKSLNSEYISLNSQFPNMTDTFSKNSDKLSLDLYHKANTVKCLTNKAEKNLNVMPSIQKYEGYTTSGNSFYSNYHKHVADIEVNNFFKNLEEDPYVWVECDNLPKGSQPISNKDLFPKDSNENRNPFDMVNYNNYDCKDISCSNNFGFSHFIFDYKETERDTMINFKLYCSSDIKKIYISKSDIDDDTSEKNDEVFVDVSIADNTRSTSSENSNINHELNKNKYQLIVEVNEKGTLAILKTEGFDCTSHDISKICDETSNIKNDDENMVCVMICIDERSNESAEQYLTSIQNTSIQDKSIGDGGKEVAKVPKLNSEEFTSIQMTSESNIIPDKSILSLNYSEPIAIKGYNPNKISHTCDRQTLFVENIREQECEDIAETKYIETDTLVKNDISNFNLITMYNKDNQCHKYVNRNDTEVNEEILKSCTSTSLTEEKVKDRLIECLTLLELKENSQMLGIDEDEVNKIFNDVNLNEKNEYNVFNSKSLENDIILPTNSMTCLDFLCKEIIHKD